MKAILAAVWVSVVAFTFPSSGFSHECLDWETISLTTTDGRTQTFTIDDDGNFSSTPERHAGRIPESDLKELDAWIDAVKEEAHDPFTCDFQPPSAVGYNLSLTFLNAGNAVVYRSSADESRACWSGEYWVVQLLLDQMLRLESAYAPQ